MTSNIRRPVSAFIVTALLAPPVFAVFVLFTENAPPVEELPPEPPADTSVDEAGPDAAADGGDGTGESEGCGCDVTRSR